MTVRLRDEAQILLEGDCPAEDAEVLLGHLLADPQATVDLRLCDHAHTAVVQVLLASRAELRGPSRGAFLRSMIDPCLMRYR